MNAKQYAALDKEVCDILDIEPEHGYEVRWLYGKNKELSTSYHSTELSANLQARELAVKFDGVEITRADRYPAVSKDANCAVKALEYFDKVRRLPQGSVWTISLYFFDESWQWIMGPQRKPKKGRNKNVCLAICRAVQAYGKLTVKAKV